MQTEPFDDWKSQTVLFHGRIICRSPSSFTSSRSPSQGHPYQQLLNKIFNYLLSDRALLSGGNPAGFDSYQNTFTHIYPSVTCVLPWGERELRRSLLRPQPPRMLALNLPAPKAPTLASSDPTEHLGPSSPFQHSLAITTSASVK